MSTQTDKNERIYPCKDCGKMRSKAEGGTTFTVCDECWDKHFRPSHPVMDSAWVTHGCREVWAAAGYNDKKKAAERFRQGPYQAWACGWMESRLALVGSGIYAKPSQTDKPYGQAIACDGPKDKNGNPVAAPSGLKFSRVAPAHPSQTEDLEVEHKPNCPRSLIAEPFCHTADECGECTCAHLPKPSTEARDKAIEAAEYLRDYSRTTSPELVAKYAEDILAALR